MSDVGNTVLHVGKSLAVATIALLRGSSSPFLRKGWMFLRFRSETSLFASRRLLSAGVTCYRPPPQLLWGTCSDFPPREIILAHHFTERLPNTAPHNGTTLSVINQTRMVFEVLRLSQYFRRVLENI